MTGQLLQDLLETSPELLQEKETLDLILELETEATPLVEYEEVKERCVKIMASLDQRLFELKQETLSTLDEDGEGIPSDDRRANYLKKTTIVEGIVWSERKGVFKDE